MEIELKGNFILMIHGFFFILIIHISHKLSEDLSSRIQLLTHSGEAAFHGGQALTFQEQKNNHS